VKINTSKKKKHPIQSNPTEKKEKKGNESTNNSNIDFVRTGIGEKSFRYTKNRILGSRLNALPP
jgi:hypothetical protein